MGRDGEEGGGVSGEGVGVGEGVEGGRKEGVGRGIGREFRGVDGGFWRRGAPSQG